jgi:hypothetical protein
MEKATNELIKRLSYISADYNTKPQTDNKLKEDHDLLVGIIRNYLNYIDGPSNAAIKLFGSLSKKEMTITAGKVFLKNTNTNSYDEVEIIETKCKITKVLSMDFYIVKLLEGPHKDQETGEVKGDRLTPSPPSNDTPFSRFKSGDRFKIINYAKTGNGTVRYLRWDDYEKQQAKKENYKQRYSVDFDNGGFETYLSEDNMEPI